MTRKIGVGLISVGWMGRLHSRAYRAVREHFPELDVDPVLVIAADPLERSAAEAVDRLGYRESSADYRDVLAHPDVDVVSICAPNFLHREFAEAAAAAGKPFWIEKPMGRDLAESQAIARAARDAGVVTAVGFNYRHAPAVEYARDMIRGGSIGRVTNVRVSLLADYSADPDGARTWRFERDRAGSGVLGDLLAHGVDLAQYLVGAISEVSALTETFITSRPLPAATGTSHFSKGDASGAYGPVENEDYAALLVRFADGAVGTFESSRVAIGPHAEYVVEVYGTAGSLRWDFQRLNELDVAMTAVGSGYRTVFAEPGFGEFARFQPGAGTSMGFDDLKTIEAYQFLRSVVEGVQCAPSVADGCSAAAVLHAAEESAASRSWRQVESVAGDTTYDQPRR